MARIGKISMIKKDVEPSVQSIMNSYRMAGYPRPPGTGDIKYPYKENNGTYRTGLDPKAKYIQSIQSKELREAEIARVEALKEEYEQGLGIDLGPRSKAYNANSDSTTLLAPFKLTEKDMLFDLSDPYQGAIFAWLRVHPSIAPSLDAYISGDVSPDTLYYVNNDDAENGLVYNKKRKLNKAISTLQSLPIGKLRKVARLMDLPYSDDTLEQTIYNGVDDLLHMSEMPTGSNKGRTPVIVFTEYVELNSEMLDVQDIVSQAFKYNIYRLKKGGKVYEGEQIMWESKEDLVEHLLDPKNQSDRLALEKKLQINKLKV